MESPVGVSEVSRYKHWFARSLKIDNVHVYIDNDGSLFSQTHSMIINLYEFIVAELKGSVEKPIILNLTVHRRSTERLPISYPLGFDDPRLSSLWICGMNFSDYENAQLGPYWPHTAFMYFPRLEEMSFKSNLFAQLSPSLLSDNLSSLKLLDIGSRDVLKNYRGCLFKDLPPTLEALVVNTGGELWKSESFEGTRLKDLNVRGNVMLSGSCTCPLLEYFECGSCTMSDSGAIFSTPKLLQYTVVVVDGRTLSTICAGSPLLREIRIYDARKVLIFPPELQCCSNLQVLDLHMSGLSEVPDLAGNLPSLEVLLLGSSLSLQHVARGLLDAPKLRVVDLLGTLTPPPFRSSNALAALRAHYKLPARPTLTVESLTASTSSSSSSPDSSSPIDFSAKRRKIEADDDVADSSLGPRLSCGVDRDSALAAVKKDPDALRHVDSSLRDDEALVLEAVRQKGGLLGHASKKLQGNKMIVMAAVSNEGYALQFASVSMRLDKDVVMSAVRQNYRALAFANTRFNSDKEVMLIAVRQNGMAVSAASADLKEDLELALVAVEQNGRALGGLTRLFQSNFVVANAAVCQAGEALEYAAEELRNDKGLVLAAVTQNGYALSCASTELKADKEVVMAASTELSSRQGKLESSHVC